MAAEVGRMAAEVGLTSLAQIMPTVFAGRVAKIPLGIRHLDPLEATIAKQISSLALRETERIGLIPRLLPAVDRNNPLILNLPNRSSRKILTTAASVGCAMNVAIARATPLA